MTVDRSQWRVLVLGILNVPFLVRMLPTYTHIPYLWFCACCLLSAYKRKGKGKGRIFPLLN